MRSRAAARSSAPKAAEEPEYKRLYKPRVGARHAHTALPLSHP